MKSKNKIGNGCLWTILVAVGVIILVNLNTPSEEEKKVMVEEKYSEVKAIPASEYCANRDGYEELIELESQSPRSEYYSNISQEKYEEYSQKCAEKTAQLIKEAEVRRISEIRTKYASFDEIYGDTRKITKEDLRNYMIKVLEITPNCFPEYVDKSTNKKRTYFLMCTDMKKVYWSESDMKDGIVRSIIPHLSDLEALAYCEELIKLQLNNPETFSPSILNYAVTKVEDSRSVVVQNFSAKNGIGAKLNYRATCLVGNEVYEIQELIQI
ncbi:MAG: hypothetical protein ISP94_01765 [SAR86 cluster bacterium]|nr:hypothetical protein [SAR86 cluster bacterium]